MGQLHQHQIEVLQRLVKGRCVHDFGAGTGLLSMAMLEWGAQEVIAIEKDVKLIAKHTGAVAGLRVYAETFEDFLLKHAGRYPMEVGLIAYPLNRPCRGLPELAARCETVIYIGTNTDCSACGTPRLFLHFRQRELLEYSPGWNCTLMALGSVLEKPRSLTGEEFAFFSQHVKQPLTWLAFDAAEKLVASKAPEVSFIEEQIEQLAGEYWLG